MFFNYAGISLVTTTSHIYSTRAEQNGALYALSVDVFMFVMLPHDHRRYIDWDRSICWWVQMVREKPNNYNLHSDSRAVCSGFVMKTDWENK